MLRLMAFHAIDILFPPVVKILADSEVLDLNKKLWNGIQFSNSRYKVPVVRKQEGKNLGGLGCVHVFLGILFTPIKHHGC